MIRMNYEEACKITPMNLYHGPCMWREISIKGFDDGTVKLYSTRQNGAIEETLEVGDYVHINMLQYSDFYYGYSPNNFGPRTKEMIWAELRQFLILKMYSEHPCGHYAIEGNVILKEIDRVDKENDGTFWILYSQGSPGTSLDTTIYISKIGKELSDEAVEKAKEHGRRKCIENAAAGMVSLAIASSEYMEYCWNSYVRNRYYNENYGKMMLAGEMRFPDKDYPPEPELGTGLEPLALLLAIIWGFIPEGNEGFMYLILALFFSACVCVMYNGWFIILCIMTIYWIKNATLKTNKRK